MVIYDLVVTFTSFIFLTVITVILRFGFTFFSDSTGCLFFLAPP